MLDTKRLGSNRGTDHVHDGIFGTDFVKMDCLDGYVMYLGFGAPSA